MKKFFFSVLTAVMAIAMVGCEYDDSELTNRVNNLEDRVITLEQLCSQMNTNITAMQAIVNALQTQDAITAVTPITEGGKTIGYTITFAKGEPITIYHGQNGKDGADGEDGYTPVIGVDQDEDGVYYWTLDGEWLTDAEGNKIATSGKDGEDGADGEGGKSGMPELKIQGGYWYVSYDGGENWERLGRATGYDGADGKDGANGKDGDAFFEKVEVNEAEGYVLFVLKKGNKEFKVPLYKFSVQILEPEKSYVVVNGNSLTLLYKISGCDNPIVSVSGNLNPSVNKNTQTITIPAPTSLPTEVVSQITLSVSNGVNTIMDVIDIYIVEAEAIDAASLKTLVNENKTVIGLADGTYSGLELKGISGVKFIGMSRENTEIRLISTPGFGDFCLENSTATLENMTIITEIKDWAGFQNATDLTFNKCDFVNNLFLSGNATFNECHFTVTTNHYNVWAYSANSRNYTATFRTCVFDCAGKSIYIDGNAGGSTTMNFTSCTFNDNDGGATDKAAIETGTTYGGGATYNVNITGCTFDADGFAINPNGINTNSTIWANKDSMSADKLNIVIDGVDVY